MKLLPHPPSERNILRALYVLVFASFLWAENTSVPLPKAADGDKSPVARKAVKKERPYLAARIHR